MWDRHLEGLAIDSGGQAYPNTRAGDRLDRVSVSWRSGDQKKSLTAEGPPSYNPGSG